MSEESTEPRDDFRALVKLMRELQREYFRTRDSTVLRHCKDAERKVDTALAEKTRSMF